MLLCWVTAAAGWQVSAELALDVVLLDYDCCRREGHDEKVIHDDAEGRVDAERRDRHDGRHGCREESHGSGPRSIEDSLHGT